MSDTIGIDPINKINNSSLYGTIGTPEFNITLLHQIIDNYNKYLIEHPELIYKKNIKKGNCLND